MHTPTRLTAIVVLFLAPSGFTLTAAGSASGPSTAAGSPRGLLAVADPTFSVTRGFYVNSQLVAITSAIWLGLTTACAACHDHKFDPISQKDFYAMSAFFRNTTMGAMDRNSAEHPPNIFAPRSSDRPRMKELNEELAKTEAAITQRRKDAGPDFQKWLTSLATEPSPIVIVDTGRLQSSPAVHPFVGVAAVTVVVHRQATQSSRAAAVRLMRRADQLEALMSLPTAAVVAVVGATPFDLADVESYLGDSVGALPIVGLPVDELAAAVFGGRTGMSSRRLIRLPLLRAAADLTAVVERSLAPIPGGATRIAR